MVTREVVMVTSKVCMVTVMVFVAKFHPNKTDKL